MRENFQLVGSAGKVLAGRSDKMQELINKCIKAYAVYLASTSYNDIERYVQLRVTEVFTSTAPPKFVVELKLSYGISMREHEGNSKEDALQNALQYYVKECEYYDQALTPSNNG